MSIDQESAVSGEGEGKEVKTGRVKCPLMTVHDMDCIEDCGNETCKYWKESEK